MSTGVGERIKNRRNELGWSQEELAHKMGFRSKSTICKIEKGEDNLTATAIQKYADALLTTPSYLMGWVEDSVQHVDTQEDVRVEIGLELGFAERRDRIQARYLYELYKNASPEVQKAVETILKSSQQTP